jgi:glycosyltransferase involved in cell wall biosynthesis
MDGDYSCAARLAPNVAARVLSVPIRKGDTRGNLGRMIACLRVERPDLLITSNWGSIEWAIANCLVGRPHLHMEDGFGSDERDGQIARRVWTRRLVLWRSLVMLPSQTLVRIATDVWRLPKRRLRYIPNGIELERFARVADDRVSEKNVARLVRAFARVRAERQARLVIVGDGPQRETLERLATTLGIRADVDFAGYRDDPAGLYADFDIFALSSDTEQMPISVLEAMAAELPVAATDVGDIGRMLAAENQPFLVPRDDVALAGTLLALIDDPQGRRMIGRANRARAERDFDVARMVERHAALIDEALATARRSRQPSSDAAPLKIS